MEFIIDFLQGTEFRGKIYFSQGQRCLGNGHFVQMLTTLFFIIVFPILFFCGMYKLSQIQIWLTVIVWLLSLYYYQKVALRDPGIIQIPIQQPEFTNEIKTVEFKDNTYALKFCSTCYIYRPLRSHHCKICNVCIERLDHHCPWINNCVALNNQTNFIVFLIFTFILVLVILEQSIQEIQVLLNNSEMGYGYNFFMSIFLTTSGVIFSFLIGCLLILQIYLISRNKTTYEFLTGTYADNNPFDEGVWSNIKQYFNKKQLDSKIDMDYLQNWRHERFKARFQINSSQTLDKNLI